MAAATVEVLFGPAKKANKSGSKPNPSTKKSPAPFGGATLIGAPHIADEPSHEEKLHRAAAEEHVNAARDFVAGRITSKQYSERKERAARFMRHTPKSKG